MQLGHSDCNQRNRRETAVTNQKHNSLNASRRGMKRREFVKTLGACSVAVGGVVLGAPTQAAEKAASPRVKTNLDDFMKVPKTKHSLPGPFPGKVVKVTDKSCLREDAVDAKAVKKMLATGVTRLTGKSMADSFGMFFEKGDIIGLKVNPVGPPLINTRPELVSAVIEWLAGNGVPKKNIVIWDRFDYMLVDAGFTAKRFPEVGIEGLQTMDLKGNKWRDAKGNHLSADNFDKQTYYFVKGVVGKNVPGYPDDEFYQNQHVFNGEYSYFGKLITRKLTKIINLPAYKNAGPGISMACKSLGYGSICNCGRLHAPLGLKVGTEVLAAPAIRDKLVLNITDGIRGQYDGGPGLNAQFVYPNCSLYFATDPFALDMICHRELAAKRKEMGVQVNDHPSFTDYLRDGEKLGLGVADVRKIKVIRT
jgi:hypothetical protein